MHIIWRNHLFSFNNALHIFPLPRTPLHWAAATGHALCVKALLVAGAAPDPRDVDGVTPLEYAQNAGHTGAEKNLIEN